MRGAPVASGRRLGLTVGVALLSVAAAAQARGPSRILSQLDGKRCFSSELRLRRGREGAAAGHIGFEVGFKNISAATCTLYGYPGMQMLNANGNSLATLVHRGIAYTVPTVPKRIVMLAPGGEASFDLGYDDSTGYGLKECPTSARVEITPPNAYTPITVPWHIQPYGGGSVTHVRCGAITVSAVFAGH
jgi:Protein of unknown function (DUF4232)